MEPIVKVFLANLIRWALKPPSKPGAFTLTVRSEESEGTMRKNVTDITLPAIAQGNPEGVNVRRFKITATGDGSVVFPEQDFAPDAGPITGVKLVQGVEIKLSLIDIDQAGNASEPDEAVVTPTDSIAPSKPGPFTMTVTGEVDEAA